MDTQTTEGFRRHFGELTVGNAEDMAMTHDKEDRLIEAHNRRFEGVEGWCQVLQEDLKKKMSTTSFWTGLTVVIVILGTALSVIWANVQENGKMMKRFQINQIRVLEKLSINPYDGD